MGKLVTKGSAKEEFEAEIIEVKIIFRKESENTGLALESVQGQCEKFLEALEKINVSPEQIRLRDNGISKVYNENKVVAEKDITIKFKIDISLCTYLFEIVKMFGEDIRYDISYMLEDEEKIDKIMLNRAVEDSRKQAEIIASSLGKSIIGVQSVNDDCYQHRNLAKAVTVGDDLNPKIPDAFKSDTPLSDRAGLPTVSKSEEITIAWLMAE